MLGACNGTSTNHSDMETFFWKTNLQVKVGKLQWLVQAKDGGSLIAFVLMSSKHEWCRQQRQLSCSCPLDGNSHLSPAW